MSQNLVVLKEKKDYYVAALTKGISNMFLEAFLSIYKAVKEKNKRKKFLMKEYQDAMKDISQWPSDIIHKEYKRFKHHYKNLDSIVTSVMLMLYTINDIKHKNFPKVEDYLYQVYLNIARQLWKEPFLVYDVSVDKVTYQKHILTIQKIIAENISKTFHDMIPEQDMCVDLTQDDESDETDDASEDDNSGNEEIVDANAERDDVESDEDVKKDEEAGSEGEDVEETDHEESEAESGKDMDDDEIFLLDKEDSIQDGPCSQSGDEDLVVVKRNVPDNTSSEEDDEDDDDADRVIEEPLVRVVNIRDPPDIKKLRTKDSFF